MYRKEVVVKTKTGLHARPGTEVAKLALSSSANVYIEFNNQRINAKEVLDVLSANIEKNSLISIIADGEGEREVVDAIAHFVSSED